jgi:hypothetical protein
MRRRSRVKISPETLNLIDFNSRPEEVVRLLESDKLDIDNDFSMTE